ncbi:hypothetical protein [Pelagibius sp. Alg239-R121]|uniref:hypothetical protein n=1 Tax=Pelagibius sp. Alg239-R121 TaxID=2993448 RepID=UPI0024A7211E|nr:hypothetical protein [Pelagibius sp. Alg239-R121]
MAAIVVAAGCSSAGSGPLLAKDYDLKNVSLTSVNSTLNDYPALVFEPIDGQWIVQEEGSFGFQARLKIGTRQHYTRVHGYKIGLVADPKSEEVLSSTGAAVLGLKKVDKNIQGVIKFPHLKRFVRKARRICESHGNQNKKVVKSFDVRMVATIAYGHKNYNGSPANLWSDPGQISYLFPVANNLFPINVVCKAAAFKVTSAELDFTYQGDRFKCPVKATLTATLRANKAGPTTLILTRDDGLSQRVNVNIPNSGLLRWRKHYNINQPTTRKYLMTVIGHAASTPWTTMSVPCASGAGSMTGPAKPQNNNKASPTKAIKKDFKLQRLRRK